MQKLLVFCHHFLFYLGNWEEDILKIRELNEEERKDLFSKL